MAECLTFALLPQDTEVQLTTGEITVGFTDYLLLIECTYFVLVLIRADSAWPAIRWLFAGFFGFTALASLSGGTYHLLLINSLSMPAVIVWKTTIIAVGFATLATWSIGAHLLFAQPTRGRIIKAASVAFVVYSIYVVAVDDCFMIAIANYIPAVVFLVIAFTWRYRQRPDPPVMLGLLGLCVTGVAAAMQRLGLSLHPLYFNHNATYHIVQAIGLFLIFRAAIFLVHNPQQTAGKRGNKI